LLFNFVSYFYNKKAGSKPRLGRTRRLHLYYFQLTVILPFWSIVTLVTLFISAWSAISLELAALVPVAPTGIATAANPAVPPVVTLYWNLALPDGVDIGTPTSVHVDRLSKRSVTVGGY